LALALYRDPQDPAAFNESALSDAGIRAACAAVRLVPATGLPTSWSARLRVVLKDGRQWQREAAAFKGMPSDEMSPAEEQQRFALLCASLPPAQSAQLYEKLSSIERQVGFPQADLAGI
jgi:hypothetical protein